MEWEAKLIENLQKMTGGVFDYIMFIFTYMGDKLFFIAIACVLYWCVSKKFGFRFISVYLFSAGCNDLIKSIFSRTRPYASYQNIKSVFTKTEGWSFPSGHSGSVAVIGTLLTKLAYDHKKFFRSTLILSIIVTVTVMFTRVYLGQHYPTDVIVGAGLGVVFALIFGFIFVYLEKKALSFWLVALPLSVLGTITLIISGDALSNQTLIQALAAYAAVSVGYMLEQKYVAYEVRSGKITKQIAKIVIGLGIAVLLVVSGEYLFGLFILNGTMLEVIFVWYFLYFIVGMWAILGANFTFKKLKL